MISQSIKLIFTNQGTCRLRDVYHPPHSTKNGSQK